MCVDPAPRVALPAEARHVPRPWQRADPTLFSELNAGDVLFIDSSHQGEETLATYLLLDALPAGVFVHFHDLLFPGPPRYPEENLVISYCVLRQARWEGVAALAILQHDIGPAGMRELFPSSARAPWRSPGSVWLRKRDL